MVFDNSTLPLKEQVTNFLAWKDHFKATEVLANHLQQQYYFQTIENDKDLEIWYYQEGIYVPNGKSLIETFVRDTVGHLFTTYLVNQVVAKISADKKIKQEDFFEQQNLYPHLLPVENGILNLRERKIYPFTHQKFFFSKIKAKYDTSKDCPAIKEFIKQITKHEVDVKTIQELIGFCLLRDYKFEKGFMLFGERGRNGKSKLLRILKEFLGKENVSSITLEDIEKDSFCLINLHNKLANIAGDLSEQVISSTGVYKRITGRDSISANRKGRSRVDFVNYAKMIFATNNLPIVNNFDNAFALRWVMVDFPYQFLPQNEIDCLEDKSNTFLQNPDILEQLINPEEFSGLLNWALEGLTRLEEDKKFANETNFNEVRKYWFRKSNSVGAFVEDLIEEDGNSYVTKHEFRRVYHNYCKRNRVKQLGDKAINFTLSSELGVGEGQVTIKESRVHVWKGIKFKQNLFKDNSQILEEHIKRNSPIKTEDLKKLMPNDNILYSCLDILSKEGKAIELPAGTWRTAQ